MSSSGKSVECEADVVVVGAGNAGLTAALAARESGARVLVLEAAPRELRGGNSQFTGGIFRVTHHGLDDLLGVVCEESKGNLPAGLSVDPYTSPDYLADLAHTTDGRADSDLVGALVSQSNDVVRWMTEKGARFELTVGKLFDPNKLDSEEHVLPPGGALRAHGEGVGLIEDLFAAAEREGIEVWYDAPVVDLLTEGRTCTGVLVRKDDRDLAIAGAVVLASGGFESSPEARQRWLGPGWDLVKVRGTRFNHGIPLMASMVHGAQAYGHWGGCHAVPLDANAPDVGDLRFTDKFSRYSYPYAVMVNKNADRFVDEGENHVWLTYAKTGAAVRAQPSAWAAQIFDVKSIGLLEPRYSTGTPVVADSIPELATKLGLDPTRLCATISTFNKACTSGTFNAFATDGLDASPEGQPRKSNWARTIDVAPFTAYPVTCGITFTFGGIRVDSGARVLDFTGTPMPGLYATGEITGGFFYHNYPAGAGLTRGAVFGRIAGHAASTYAEKPHTRESAIAGV